MITRFFGDGDHAFALTGPMILELERTAGAGIGTICRRVPAGTFTLADLIETIRLALIGGGMPPKRAAELVQTYADPTRGLGELMILAVDILTDLWAGPAKVTRGTNSESSAKETNG